MGMCSMGFMFGSTHYIDFCQLLVTGLFVSGILQYLVKEFTDVHLLMYAFTGMFSSVVIGYLASLFFGKEDKEKMKFTYFNLKK